MAQFIGFKCDSCGAVISTDDRNRLTLRFEGPAARGEYSQDLCTECAQAQVPQGVELRPLRRRRTKEEIEAEEAAERAAMADDRPLEGSLL